MITLTLFGEGQRLGGCLGRISDPDRRAMCGLLKQLQDPPSVL